MANLFNRLFSEAKTEKAVTGKATITVNLVDDDGEKVKFSGKPATLPEATGTEFYAKALAACDEAKMAQKNQFEKSSGSKSVGVEGKFAAKKFLEHENAA